MSDDEIIPLGAPETIARVGGLPDETRVTLALYGENLDPVEVSRCLGCAATRAHKRGEVRTQSERARLVGASQAPLWKEWAWLLTVEGVAPQDPDELITLLLSRFPRDPEFWASLGREYDIQIRVGIHT